MMHNLIKSKIMLLRTPNTFSRKCEIYAFMQNKLNPFLGFRIYYRIFRNLMLTNKTKRIDLTTSIIYLIGLISVS